MRGVIEKIDGPTATLRLANGTTVHWPVVDLPGARTSAVVEGRFTVVPPPAAEDAAARARELLNSILRGTPPQT